MSVSAVAQFQPNDLYVYSLSKKVLDTFELMYFDSSAALSAPTVPLNSESLKRHEDSLATQELKASKTSNCATCEIALGDSEELREHCKSDLHRFNIKRKLNSLPPVDEEEFEKLLESLEESISGSDSSDSEDELETIFEKVKPDLEQLSLTEGENSVSFLNTRSPYILFKSTLLPSTKCFGIYKSTFSAQTLETNPLEDLKLWQRQNQASKTSALFMIGGGHFAGAIISHKPKNVKGNTGSPESLLEQSVDLLDHKTFHRYTTRRKQGGSQSASDNARGKAKSAGSSLRRYNEAALEIEVRALLSSWKKALDNCESIFVRANGSSNRNILIGYEGAVLKTNDPRIRSFPFTTKRATASELKKAWVNLSYATIMDVPATDEKARLRAQKEKEVLANSTKTMAKQVKEKTDEEKHTQELISLIKKSKAPALISYLKKNKISPDFELQPAEDYITTPTLMHYASAHGHAHSAQVLLINVKANPCVKSTSGKTPYDVASSNQIRQVFRIARFNLGESYCNWKDAHVGEPKSKEAFAAEDEKSKQEEELEKKKLIEEQLAKHKAEVVEEREKKFGAGKNLGVVTSITNDMSALSEAQRMRLMREQRARAAEERMNKMMQK